jgi:hypothetical protein
MKEKLQDASLSSKAIKNTALTTSQDIVKKKS